MEQLLRAYYRDRIAAIDSLLRDAPDDDSRRLYAHLRAGYMRDLKRLDDQSRAELPERSASGQIPNS